MKKNIKLGSSVKDAITGLKGVAIGRAEYLYSCPRILVQPEGLNDGKIISSEWMDEPRLNIVENDDSGLGFTT